MGLDVLCQALARPREAVLFCGPHADQLLAAPQEGAQRLRLGVGQWPGRRADHVGKVGQRAGIQGIRLGQLPRGARKIARLPRVHNDDGEARRRQRRRGDPLQAAVLALTTLRTEAAGKVLLDLTEDAREAVRLAVVEALEGTQDETLRKRLQTMAAKEKSARVRAAVKHTLES